MEEAANGIPDGRCQFDKIFENRAERIDTVLHRSPSRHGACVVAMTIDEDG